jgi:peptidoglycan L-alanyl-D-glutamate endopeptidase CwlK
MIDKLSEDRIKLLHPAIAGKTLSLLNQFEQEHGTEEVCIRVVQGLRTIEEQNALYAKGRTAPGPVVTKAKGGCSYHNYGLSIDCCWLWRQEDGSYKYDDVKSWSIGPKFKKLVSWMKDNGYEWGGDWKTISDFPHFQKTMGYSWRQLYKKYITGDTFSSNGITYVNL